MKMLIPLFFIYSKIFNKKIAMCRLINFLRSTSDIKVIQTSTLIFMMTLINMIVMFLPIKVFLIVSSGKPMASLSFSEPYLGIYHSEIILLSLTVLLYIFNVIINIYSSRLANVQNNEISKSKYVIDSIGVTLTKNEMLHCTRWACKWLSDGILITSAIVAFLIGSWHFALLFLCLMFVYFGLVEYFVFTKNKFKFLDKLKLDEGQIMTVSIAVFYLFAFFLFFYVYLVFGIKVHFAILMLFLLRLANASFKSYLLTSFKVDTALRNKMK